jgi:hypothetical protein
MASNPTDNQNAPVVLAEPFLFGILGLGILNGIFSPFTGFVFLVHAFWYPSTFLPVSAPFILLFASLITSTFTIMLAGVPAALYERFANGGRTNTLSLWIWVSTLAILSLPAVLRAFSAL